MQSVCIIQFTFMSHSNKITKYFTQQIIIFVVSTKFGMLPLPKKERNDKEKIFKIIFYAYSSLIIFYAYNLFIYFEEFLFEVEKKTKNIRIYVTFYLNDNSKRVGVLTWDNYATCIVIIVKK